MLHVRCMASCSYIEDETSALYVTCENVMKDGIAQTEMAMTGMMTPSPITNNEYHPSIQLYPAAPATCGTPLISLHFFSYLPDMLL